jgi:Flp pilus assembly pilin Flp
MKSLFTLLKNYWMDEDGQTSMEYILILALAAAVIFKLKGQFTNGMRGITEKVFSGVDRFADDLIQ